MNNSKPVAIVDAPFDVEETGQPFGKRYGQENVALTAEHIQALKDGKHIAVDVREEYVVFLHQEGK
jgi:hypothetical protein